MWVKWITTSVHVFQKSIVRNRSCAIVADHLLSRIVVYSSVLMCSRQTAIILICHQFILSIMNHVCYSRFSSRLYSNNFYSIKCQSQHYTIMNLFFNKISQKQLQKPVKFSSWSKFDKLINYLMNWAYRMAEPTNQFYYQCINQFPKSQPIDQTSNHSRKL